MLKRRQWLGLAAAGMTAGCRSSGRQSAAPGRLPYPDFRASHRTVLQKAAPAPAPFDNAALDARFQPLAWPGPLGDMHGWLARPPGDGPFPGLVWLHGSFAASAAQLEPLGQAFPPPGVAVFIPAWRGENGNPWAR